MAQYNVDGDDDAWPCDNIDVCYVQPTTLDFETACRVADFLYELRLMVRCLVVYDYVHEAFIHAQKAFNS